MLVFMQVGTFIQLAVGESRFALGRDLCISTSEYGPDLCTSYFVLRLGVLCISCPTGTQATFRDDLLSWYCILNVLIIHTRTT